MRVVLVSPLPPDRDGIATYSAGLLDGYRRAGHQVAVVPLRPTTTAVIPVLGALSLSPIRWFRTWRAVRRWGPDLVHVQHTIATYGLRLVALWALAIVMRAHGMQLVVTHHEVTRDVARLGRPGAAYYRLTCRLAHRVHVHTHAAGRFLTDRLGLPTASLLVKPHPIFEPPDGGTHAAELRRRHRLDGSRVLLLFGYVHVEKGILETVRAVACLLAAEPRLRSTLRVVVAGDVRPRPAGFHRFEQADHDYLRLVRDEVQALDLADVVRFVGAVPDEQVQSWFNLAELALLPYVATEQSGVLGLAIAAGTPVLATGAGGLGELIAGELPTIDDLAPAPFGTALAAALADPAALRSRAVVLYERLRADADPEALVCSLTSTDDRVVTAR